jgi:two-component system response regulator DesR
MYDTAASSLRPIGLGAEVVSLDRARARRALVQQAQRLSRRERSVLEQLATGNTTEEAAGELHLSPHTVRTHLKSAVRKLGARTRVHAVAIALAGGVIDVERI